jgi:hypothetical protein
MRFVVDGETVDFGESDLPMLISGKEGSGASFFSVCVAAQMLKKGSAVVFFSAYPMAKDDLRRLTTEDERQRAMIIESGEEEALIAALDKAVDEPMIFIKNIENYSDRLFTKIEKAKRLIVSGDIDKCQFIGALEDKTFATKIFFTKPVGYPVNDFPSLEKYKGYIEGPGLRGKVALVDEADG